MPFSFFECSEQSCRFRFPIEIGRQEGHFCPHCGAFTRQVESSTPVATTAGGSWSGPTIVALLDNIRSALNVGSIFRIADGAGIEQLHLCGITATPEHPKVAKTALGAEQAVSWRHHRNGLSAGRMLQAAGYQLWALESEPGALSLAQVGPLITPIPIALIVGHEKAGIDPGILALCERVFYIPMHGRKDSLNVSVAFGIAAYSIRLSYAGGKP